MDRQTSWEPAPDSGIAIKWLEANGLTFEVAEAGQGDKLALCLHGFPELHFSWRHQMPLLAEMGYCVWAPNMRGYGETTRPPNKKDYRLDNLMFETTPNGVAPRATNASAARTLSVCTTCGAISFQRPKWRSACRP